MYFIIVWQGDKEERIIRAFTEKELFDTLSELQGRKITIYKGECILDWS